MSYRVNDLVICKPSGRYNKNRIGKVIKLSDFDSKVLVGYIDYPEEYHGWFHPMKIWVEPIEKIIFPSDN
jgi:hypothetical protein